MSIQWDNRMEIGIPYLDSDHMKLLDVINSLDFRVSDQNIDNLKIINILKMLVRYSAEHFAKEEDLFKRFNYPGNLAHKSSHKNFISKVVGLQKLFLSGDAHIHSHITIFLVDWLFDHILEEDMQYKRFFMDQYQEVTEYCALQIRRGKYLF